MNKNFVWLSSCVLAIVCSKLSASESIDQLCYDLGAENFKARENAERALFERALSDRNTIASKVAKLSEETKDPAIRYGSIDLLKKIYKRYELGIGGSEFGFTLGWFIEDDGESISSYPMILTIEEDGPAAKAGLNRGDVIFQAQGKTTRGVDSRNELIRKLAVIKPGDSVTFEIHSNGKKSPYGIQLERTQKKKVTLAPIPGAQSPEGQEKSFEENVFKDWVRKLNAGPEAP